MKKSALRLASVAPLSAALAFSAIVLACNTAELKDQTPIGGDPGAVDGGSDGRSGAREGGRDPIADQDAAAIPATSSVTIQVMPGDDGAAVLSAISGAKESVHLTMYLLSSYKMVGALINLQQDGKDVKVVLNQNFPEGGNANQQAYDDLTAKGVPVVWAPAAYNFTHAKTVVIDGEKVLVMTMNLTQSSFGNREFVATDTDPEDVAEAEAIFQGDFANAATSVEGKLLVSPRNAAPVDARARLKALIDSALVSLDVEGETLSDDTITEAIIAAHQAGVDTRVVLNGDLDPTPAQRDSVALMKEAGVPIRKVSSSVYIHAKAIVVDEELAYVGSLNFTANSLLSNREIGLITDAKAEVAKVRGAIAEDFAAGEAP